ncbi:MAG: hypothetical protein H6P99_2312 [Holophagaceae bacterium]|nr:hypothetical protein [Holophagaceae bacterium]
MKSRPTHELRGTPAAGQKAPDPVQAPLHAAIQGLLVSLDEVQDHYIAMTTRLRNAPEVAGAANDWDDLLRGAHLLEQARNRAAALSVWRDPHGPRAGDLLPMADPDRPLTGTSLGSPVTLPLGLSLRRLERFWILSTLEALDGNRSLCARHLDVALRTIVRKLGEFKALGHRVPTAVPGRRRRGGTAPCEGAQSGPPGLASPAAAVD